MFTYLHANDVFPCVVVRSADGSMVDSLLEFLDSLLCCAGYHDDTVVVCVCVSARV